MNKLFELFNLASEQFQHGLIRQSVLIQWLRTSHVIPNTYSLNIIGICNISFLYNIFLLIEGVISSVLARHINAKIYKLGTDTFEWNGFMECIRMLANEIHLSLNEFVKKMLIADEFSFQRWQTDIEYIPEVGINIKTNRLWDAKKVNSFLFYSENFFLSIKKNKGSCCC